MPEVEIAWGDLREALKNEVACERYEASRKHKGKNQKEVISSLEILKEELRKGVVYGNTRDVRVIL